MKPERNINTFAIIFFIGIFFAVLVVRLWHLQILRGAEYGRIAFENRLRIEKVPAPRGIIYDRWGKALVQSSAAFSVALNPELIDETDMAATADFLGLDRQWLMRRAERARNTIEPMILMEGLTMQEVARIEARISDFPGLNVIVDKTRHYIYGDVGSHMIGYLGRITPAQAERPEFADVPMQAYIGQFGVEKLFDETLRGVPGGRAIEVNALGQQIRVIEETPPRRGESIHLSIDIEMMMKANEVFGDRKGAFVAIRPKTGEILGMLSKPSYDSNLFSLGIRAADWNRLINDPDKPMLNRALQSQYPPGSTFKIVTGLAALESGSITPQTNVTCSGGLQYGKWRFGCWKKKGHGTLSFMQGLVQSCDVFFYTVGAKAGINSIAAMARRLGMGGTSSLGLSAERPGLIPDEEWKKENRKDNWYLGETYNAAIGQGYVAVTPFQLARMVAAVSADGRLYEPSLMRIPIAKARRSKEDTKDFDPGNIALVREALKGVVNDPRGTAYSSRTTDFVMAGKTGTAQVYSMKGKKYSESGMPEELRDHAWFVAYAPAENPEIAMAVFVEHGGHGGSAAAPIAKQAIEVYMKNLEANNAN